MDNRGLTSLLKEGTDWDMVQTGDGKKVRILCTDGPSGFPIIGIIENDMIVSQWDEYGRVRGWLNSVSNLVFGPLPEFPYGSVKVVAPGIRMTRIPRPTHIKWIPEYQTDAYAIGFNDKDKMILAFGSSTTAMVFWEVGKIT
jgi:hypothetical protein